MKYVTGKLNDGLIVPDEPLDLPDGSAVHVIGVMETVSGRDWWLPLAGISRDDAGIKGWVRERESGKLSDGVIVPDKPLDLPDGSTVLVVGASQTGSAWDWLLQFAGIWEDDPGIDAWVAEREAESQAWDRQHS
ncbi:MAG: hypothetical protein ACR2PL_23795 [Dehalococcoidia bacterium]